MKDSKVFLCITAGVLAIVAFTSAKAKWSTIPVGSKTTGANMTCVFDAFLAAQTIVNGSQLRLASHLLYSFSTNGVAPHKGICGNPVYTEQQ
jgi:hypothetical protein